MKVMGLERWGPSMPHQPGQLPTRDRFASAKSATENEISASKFASIKTSSPNDGSTSRRTKVQTQRTAQEWHSLPEKKARRRRCSQTPESGRRARQYTHNFVYRKLTSPRTPKKKLKNFLIYPSRSPPHLAWKPPISKHWPISNRRRYPSRWRGKISLGPRKQEVERRWRS